MTDRIVLIGLGGIGSQLLPSLVRYLGHRPEPRPLLVLVDGDAYEPANRSRQLFPDDALGTNKAVVREGDLCLLAVDNHPTRALVDRHIAGLADVTLISGGNDETDGNVQLVRRRDGYSVDGHLTEIHPEIGLAVESDVMPGTGCAALTAERPQLVVTNLMVASAMLNCLWAVTEQGSVPYSEVYLDVVHNAARSRSWFRVPAGAP